MARVRDIAELLQLGRARTPLDSDEVRRMLPTPPPGLADPIQEHYQRLLAFPLETQERMQEAVDRHLANLRQQRQRYPELNLEAAEALSERIQQLLDYDAATTLPLHQRWIQAAARYFFLGDDGEHDWEHHQGFDDDLQVVEVVEKALCS